MDTSKQIWLFLKSHGLNDYGAAGLMGNLYAESGLNPQNLQNSYEKKLGYTDATYTAAVDSGAYSNFVRDSAGYGLAQWTYWSRKQGLLDFCKATGASIGDLDTQLGFLLKELSESFPGVLSVLKNAVSIREASNAVLFDFERPANQGSSVQNKRASYGQVYFDKYSNGKGDELSMSNSPLATYTNISPNKNSPRNHAIDRVTIHCFVGQVTAKRGCDVFKPSSKKASCNYVVGYDGSIGLCVDEKDRSWCSSSSANDNRAITIETASDNYDPYAVTDKAYAALIDLVTDICKRNGKTKIIWFGDKDTALSYNPAPNEMVMTVHRWFANKSCPGPYLYERQGEIAAEVNRRLSSEEEDEFMTSQEKFNEMFAVAMDEYRKRLRDNDSGSWSQEARDWSTSSGLIAGGGNMIDGTTNYMWEDFLTREQAAQLFYRFNQMK